MLKYDKKIIAQTKAKIKSNRGIKVKDAAWERSERLLGAEGMEKLKSSRVAVFGLGGVGSYAAEALARAGVGALDLIDADRIALSNLNRQLYALRSTVGRYKTEVAKERIADIAPDCAVRVFSVFFSEENKGDFPFASYDYVIDCIDSVASKVALAEAAAEAGVPLIASMGTGNKLDPTGFRVADIEKTSVCPLARVMRRELKARGIRHLKVVYSEEVPAKTAPDGEKPTPASVPFVPPVAGFILAGEVIKALTAGQDGEPPHERF